MESSTEHFVNSLDVTSISTTLTLGLLGSLLIFVITRQSFGKRDKLPPGPIRIPFPLNLITCLFTKTSRMDALLSAKQRYGDLATIDFDGQLRVLLGDPELVREIFAKRGDVTSGRTNPAAKEIIGMTGGIMFGESWQPLRRFCLSALRSFGMGKRSIAVTIAEEARIFTEELWNSQTSEGVNPGDILNNAVSNIICSITFGQRFEYSDPEFVIQVQNIKRMLAVHTLGRVGRIIAQQYPSLIVSCTPKKRLAFLQSLKDFIVKQVEEHDRTFNGDDIRDVVDSLLAECRRLEESRVQNPYIRKEEIWMPVWDLFFAGTETTASAMAWFFLFMAGHPEVQEQVIKEIDAIIGQERAPNYEDRKSMPYTEATLMEILRYRPVAPFGIQHHVSEHFTVRDYVIPKGTVLLANILGIHHDPELFPEPSKFDPTRFLSEDKRTVIKNEAYIPFSLGRRSCLGEQLARMEFFLFATSVLQRFSIRLPVGSLPDYSIGHSMITLLPSKYTIYLEKRHVE